MQDQFTQAFCFFDQFPSPKAYGFCCIDHSVLADKLRSLDLIRAIFLIIYMLDVTARFEEVALVSTVNL